MSSKPFGGCTMQRSEVWALETGWMRAGFQLHPQTEWPWTKYSCPLVSKGNLFQEPHWYQNSQILYIKWHRTVGTLYHRLFIGRFNQLWMWTLQIWRNHCIPMVMPWSSHWESGDNNNTYFKGCGWSNNVAPLNVHNQILRTCQGYLIKQSLHMRLN